VAFHARNWDGVDYSASPPLFTLRSMDNRPLSKSRKVRVFHAFGDDKIKIGSATVFVSREQLVDPKATSH
jgi:hypothetical protein